MKAKSLVGRKFDLLTVRDEYTNEKGYRVCLCECKCGNVKVVHKSNLTSGRTKSCGCLEEAHRRKYNDLTGMVFDRLKAVAPTSQRKDGHIVWECECECGNTVFVSGRYLTRGYTKSCGCISEEKRDITLQRFGQLVALYPDKTSTKGPQKWICRCDCKNYCSVSISNLRDGHTRSCGCLHNKEYRTMVEGTCLEVIASEKIPVNNKSGVKGVSYYSRTGEWVATINLSRKHYHLGKYPEVSEAAKARQRAEGELFDPILQRYHHLLKKPKAEDENAE
jgi:hypothetical protein